MTGIKTFKVTSIFSPLQNGVASQLLDNSFRRHEMLAVTLFILFALSIASSSRMLRGDEIIAYNGVRVFNPGDLAPLVTKYATSGNTLAVDVLREGRTIRLSVEGGDLRVRPDIPLASAGDLERRLRTGTK